MTQSKHVGGVVVPLVTPFDHNGDLAAENARGLIEQLLDLGVHGFYVGGSTGEGFFQSADERKERSPKSRVMVAFGVCCRIASRSRVNGGIHCSEFVCTKEKYPIC